MRFKQKLEEANLTNSKTDEILLKRISNDIFRQIKRQVNDYMYQIDIPEGVDKNWKIRKKQLAYKTVVNNLNGMERDIK